MRGWVQIYGTRAWLYMSGILAKGEIWRLAALLWSLAHWSSQLLNSVCKERPCLKKIRWSVIVEGTERKPLACLHMHKHLPLATATTLFIVRTPNTMLFPSILTYSCTPLVRTGLRLCLPRSPLTSGAAFSGGYDRERISKKKNKEYKPSLSGMCVGVSISSASGGCPFNANRQAFLTRFWTPCLGFQIYATDPPQVLPGVRFKDGILCRSPWLQATLYPLVLIRGRHSSLPWSCTPLCVALAVFAGVAS